MPWSSIRCCVITENDCGVSRGERSSPVALDVASTTNAPLPSENDDERALTVTAGSVAALPAACTTDTAPPSTATSQPLPASNWPSACRGVMRPSTDGAKRVAGKLPRTVSVMPVCRLQAASESPNGLAGIAS